MTTKHITRLALVAGLLGPMTTGCYLFKSVTVLTPAQMTERETRHYPGVDREKAIAAVATALDTLGYKVTVRMPEKGVVKTAPKTVSVSATSNGYTASATEDQLAWTITVGSAGTESVVRAVPRPFRNGNEIGEGEMKWAAEAIDPKFRDLWKELDAALGVTPAEAAPAVSLK
jgi:hypothetical protein